MVYFSDALHAGLDRAAAMRAGEHGFGGADVGHVVRRRGGAFHHSEVQGGFMKARHGIVPPLFLSSLPRSGIGAGRRRSGGPAQSKTDGRLGERQAPKRIRGRALSSQRTPKRISGEAGGQKEKLPNLPNLPKLIYGFLRIGVRLGHEKGM